MATAGNRVRAMRKELGLSQSELARLAGIKQPSVSLIETGDTRSLAGATLLGLCRALRTNSSYIMRGTGNRHAVELPQDDESELLVLYRQMPEPLRAGLMASARALVDAAISTAQESSAKAKSSERQ